MNQKIKFPEASDKDKFLYTCLGESLCAVQILEDTVSHAIILKKTEPTDIKKAEILLKKQQRYTLGRVINIVKEEVLLPKSLEIQLSKILSERNWLVHHCITENKEIYKSDVFYENLYKKTKDIATRANRLQVLIELDLIEYAEEKGIDLKAHKTIMNKLYGISFSEKK